MMKSKLYFHSTWAYHSLYHACAKGILCGTWTKSGHLTQGSYTSIRPCLTTKDALSWGKFSPVVCMNCIASNLTQKVTQYEFLNKHLAHLAYSESLKTSGTKYLDLYLPENMFNSITMISMFMIDCLVSKERRLYARKHLCITKCVYLWP